MYRTRRGRPLGMTKIAPGSTARREDTVFTQVNAPGCQSLQIGQVQRREARSKKEVFQ